MKKCKKKLKAFSNDKNPSVHSLDIHALNIKRWHHPPLREQKKCSSLYFIQASSVDLSLQNFFRQKCFSIKFNISKSQMSVLAGNLVAYLRHWYFGSTYLPFRSTDHWLEQNPIAGLFYPNRWSTTKKIDPATF